MKPFLRLISRIKKYKSYFGLSIFFNILLSVFTVVSIPVIIPFFQILFDRIPKTHSADNDLTSYFQALIYSQGKQRALVIACVMILLVFFLKNLFRFLSMYFLVPVRTGITKDIRSELFRKYLYLPVDYYSNIRAGDLSSRITMDVLEIEESILRVIQVIFKSPLIILGSIFFMVYISLELSIFVVVLLLVTVFIIGGISKTLKHQSGEAQSIMGRIMNIVQENISGIRIIKAFGAEDYQKGRFETQIENYRRTISKILHRKNLSSPLSEFLGIAVVTALLWYGSKLVLDHKLLPEVFFAFIFAFYQVIEPAKNLSTAYYSIQKGLAALDRVETLLHQKDEFIEQGDKRPFSFEKKIAITSLSYQYPDDDRTVLSDINLQINKGEMVAFVGPSGSGKTTLVNLLLGFFPLQKGQGDILIDGISVREIDMSMRRSLFGLVSQNPVLFHDTVGNNIRFGGHWKKEEVIRAAQIANAHDFIMSLPDGYDTVIGDQGMKLSGGERQRLTIARAILHDPAILILDEATSSLDSESEQQVQLALEKVLRDRTAIVIAHRLSTIKNADKIIVMDRGKIVIMGRHDDLYNLSPLYKKHVDLQGV